ncbi:MAG TPA: EAL domain-containing protein [Planctomycetota bacterium]|nr:EAL domain-containing protein [Planctomycetota bacterium]
MDKAGHDGPDRPLLLIADPDAHKRGSLGDALRTAGFRVEPVADLAACVSAIEQTRPDLVLVDASLSGCGGAELGRCLRSASEADTTPIIMLMGNEDIDSLAETRAAGVSDFIDRSTHPVLVEHRVRSVIQTNASLLALDGDGPQTASASTRPMASQRELERVIAQVMSLDERVAVLCIGTLGDPANALHPTDLQRALTRFSEDSPKESPLGMVRVVPTSPDRVTVVVSGVGRLQDVGRLAACVRDSASRPAEGASDGEPLAIVVGVSTAPADATTPANLLDNARSAMTTAARQKQGCVRFHDEALNRWSLARLTLEQDLRSAIANDELVVHYQPKVDIQSLRVVGMEALVRWNHTQLGMISPNQFIPLAEETGLIIPIGQWVLETACAQNKRWQALGFAPVRMGVNLSPVQFRQPDLLEVVQRTLRDTDVDPRWLELELTEGMLMHEVTATLDCLRGLKELGVHLSIDDFGTGYSSLSYLKQFPIDTLKIDQSFVRDVTSNADDAAIVTSIILMGHGLKLNIIAEGVETDSQLEFLRALRCNEIQGYLISPPVPADEAGRLLPTL